MGSTGSVHLFTATGVAAVSSPASGPVSNAAVSVSGAAGPSVGTRTEAGQNVPHANPDRAELTNASPARSANAANPSPRPLGAAGVPRPAETISSPSPVYSFAWNDRSLPAGALAGLSRPVRKSSAPTGSSVT